MKKDKKLENILRSIEVDRPSTSFNDDIMNIILNEERVFQLDEIKDIKIERAPMHMSDMVLDEIISKKQNNRFSILSSSDIKIGIILLAIVFIPTLIACIRFQGLPNLSISSDLQQLIFNCLLIPICVAILWVADRRLRPI